MTVAVLVSAPPSGGAQGRLDEARAAIVAAEKARGVEVIEDPMALVNAGWTAEKNLAFFAGGAQLVSDGRRALARVELEKAETLFAASERAYRSRVRRAGVAAEWAEAAKWHGVALYELKRRDQAAEAWSRAKALAPDVQLTEAMVRPEVASAFAAAVAGRRPNESDFDEDVEELSPASPVEAALRTLGADEVVQAAIAIDAGALTYAAALHRQGCATAVIASTRADELSRRLREEQCRPGALVPLDETPVIAHPRPVPVVGKRGQQIEERRVPVWRRPWLWVGVVGAIGVGVVLGVSLWPREATYSTTIDYHQFSLGVR